ncbi:MAG: zinc ABC transporter substrate-binding protein, partial [Halobacteriales archaeon]
MHFTRRAALTTAAVTTAHAATGCLSADPAQEGHSVEASFPVVADYASQVSPDETEVDSLVPLGQHGHGWEPSPDVQRS